MARDHVAIEIEPSGKCVDAKIYYSSKVGSEDVFSIKHKQIGNTTYCLERDIGIFDTGYSRLVKIDEDGTKTILYDATTLGYFVGAYQYLLLSLFPILGIKTFRDKLKEDEEVEEEG